MAFFYGINSLILNNWLLIGRFFFLVDIAFANGVFKNIFEWLNLMVCFYCIAVEFLMWHFNASMAIV
jgi:hypothetical protein